MGCELWNVVPNDRVECSETMSDKSAKYHRYSHSHIYQCVFSSNVTSYSLCLILPDLYHAADLFTTLHPLTPHITLSLNSSLHFHFPPPLFLFTLSINSILFSVTLHLYLPLPLSLLFTLLFSRSSPPIPRLNYLPWTLTRPRFWCG